MQRQLLRVHGRDVVAAADRHQQVAQRRTVIREHGELIGGRAVDVPDDWTFVSLGKLTGPIEVKGIAYGGDRGISRVEVSYDDGKTWSDAEVYYKGGDLAWSLWKAQWTPTATGDYALVVRATDTKGDVQRWEENRGPFSGVSGLHTVNVRVTA